MEKEAVPVAVFKNKNVIKGNSRSVLTPKTPGKQTPRKVDTKTMSSSADATVLGPSRAKRQKLIEQPTETSLIFEPDEDTTGPVLCKISNVIGNASISSESTESSNKEGDEYDDFETEQPLTLRLDTGQSPRDATTTAIQSQSAQKMVMVKVARANQQPPLATLQSAQSPNSTLQLHPTTVQNPQVVLFKLVQQPNAPSPTEQSPTSPQPTGKRIRKPTEKALAYRKQDQQQTDSSPSSSKRKTEPERGKVAASSEKKPAYKPLLRPSVPTPLTTRKRSRESGKTTAPPPAPASYTPKTAVRWTQEEKNFIVKYVTENGGYDSVTWSGCALQLKTRMDIDRTAKACQNVYLRDLNVQGQIKLLQEIMTKSATQNSDSVYRNIQSKDPPDNPNQLLTTGKTTVKTAAKGKPAVQRKVVYLQKKASGTPAKDTGNLSEDDLTVEDTQPAPPVVRKKITVDAEIQTDITIGPWDHFAFACLKQVRPKARESGDKPIEDPTLQTLLRGEPAPSPKECLQASQKPQIKKNSDKQTIASQPPNIAIPSSSQSPANLPSDLSKKSSSEDPTSSGDPEPDVADLFGDLDNASDEEDDRDHAYSKGSPEKEKQGIDGQKDNMQEGDLSTKAKKKPPNPDFLAALERISKKPKDSELSVINLLKLKVLLETRSIAGIAKGILTVPDLTNAVFNMLMKHEMDKVTRLLARKLDMVSVLTHKSYEDLMTLSMGTVATEMVTTFPYLSRMLMSFMLPADKRLNVEAQEALAPRLGMIYAILGISRCKELSRVQRFLTMSLVDQLCDKKLYHKLNSLGFTLSYTSSHLLARAMGKPLGDTDID